MAPLYQLLLRFFRLIVAFFRAMMEEGLSKHVGDSPDMALTSSGNRNTSLYLLTSFQPIALKGYLQGLLLFICVFAGSSLSAQYKVRFVVTDKSHAPKENVYLAGSFNNWDSTPNPAYKLQPLNRSAKTIILNCKGGRLEYKYHRGSWKTVEKQYFGWEVPNRVVTINKDTTLSDVVDTWHDQLLPEKWYALSQEQPDTSRVLLLSSLATVYGFVSEKYNVDSALYYSGKALVLLPGIKSSPEFQGAGQKRYAFYLINVQETAAALLHALGNYSKSLELRLDNLRMAQKEKNSLLEVFSLEAIGSDYAAMKDYQNELKYANLLQSLVDRVKDSLEWGTDFIETSAYKRKADAFFHLKKMDSALYYTQHLTSLAAQYNYLPGLAYGNQLLGSIYLRTNALRDAIRHYHHSIVHALKSHQHPVLARSQEGLARVYQRMGNIDSALYYAKLSLLLLRERGNIQAWGENRDTYIAEISPLLASLYNENQQLDSAYKYLHLSVELKDSLYNLEKVRQFQHISFNETIRQQQIGREEVVARQQYENKIKFIVLLAGLLAAVIVAFLLYKNNRQKQKANTLLQKQKLDTETALEQLKLTQNKLVQKEKMASLGELTAGIAHEIQNPLNFVNNFSEVTAEMVEEALEGVRSGNTDHAAGILNDVKTNLQKIAFHGNRADSIIKNMMEHSRGIKGKKEKADINLLTEEYLKMAYHGFKVKNGQFNLELETNFDPAVNKANVRPQDIGRVMLNLLNNAFYSVQQKKRLLNGAYKPVVQVSTRSRNGAIEVVVKDNGIGIPKKVQGKIYQPFFTTKPAGEGTGLGLSLSYDIITKGHGGELLVESKEGEGAEFIVQLPAEKK